MQHVSHHLSLVINKPGHFNFVVSEGNTFWIFIFGTFCAFRRMWVTTGHPQSVMLFKTFPGYHLLLSWGLALRWHSPEFLELPLSLFEIFANVLTAYTHWVSCQCKRPKRHGFNPWLRKIAWVRAWQPTPVSLPRESHGQRSLVGCGPQSLKEADMNEVT